jgi:hypothetical protein
MLYVGENVYQPDGAQSSYFAAESELHALRRTVEQYYRSEATPAGVCFEVPFGNDTVLVEMWNDKVNPSLGNGLLSLLQLRVPSDAATVVKIAADLNYREACGDVLSVNFGAWCINMIGDQSMLAYVRFTPNFLYRPMLSTDVAYSMVNHVTWAAEVLGHASQRPFQPPFN